MQKNDFACIVWKIVSLSSTLSLGGAYLLKKAEHITLSLDELNKKFDEGFLKTEVSKDQEQARQLD